jgi:hypothetical protein
METQRIWSKSLDELAGGRKIRRKKEMFVMEGVAFCVGTV